MKCKAALLILICCSCNAPFRQIAHEAAIAEQAIEADLDDDCPGCQAQRKEIAKENQLNTNIKNKRQYPKRERQPNPWDKGI